MKISNRAVTVVENCSASEPAGKPARRHLIYARSDPQGPGFRLELGVTHHCAGTTLEFFTVHPGARVPDPHRKFSLTLPPEVFRQLAQTIEATAGSPGESGVCDHEHVSI